MIKGKTKTGFEFSIKKRVTDDYELLELLAVMEENPLVITKILTKLLGDEKQNLIEHVREEDGIVPADKIGAEIENIFESVGEVKNS